jgi:hypothetical protein
MPRLDFDTGLKKCSKCDRPPRLASEHFYRNNRGYGDGYQSQCILCVGETARKSLALREGVSRPTLLEDPVWREAWATYFLVPPYDFIPEDSDDTITRESLLALLDTWGRKCPRCRDRRRPVTHYADTRSELTHVFSLKAIRLLCSTCSRDLHDPANRSWSGLKRPG